MLVDLPPVPREGGALAHVLTKTEAVRLLREAQLRHVGLHAPLERLWGDVGRDGEMWGDLTEGVVQQLLIEKVAHAAVDAVASEGGGVLLHP